jgi:hypothetical protein
METTIEKENLIRVISVLEALESQTASRINKKQSDVSMLEHYMHIYKLLSFYRKLAYYIG